LDGGLWHPYRRKWVTDRKHLSPVDVAAAGGWEDVATMLKSYAKPTNKTLLAVMSAAERLRDVAIAR
jgi:hypothetical protein